VESITKLFAGKYIELYMSVPYDKSELHYIINDVKLSMSDSSVTSDHIFQIKDIKHAVSKLKPHVGEGSLSLTSDHVVNAGNDFMCHIAFLFTSFVVHGSVPDGFLSSTIISIPKGYNANMSDSTNFRGIALSSLFGKIFDNIILDRYCDKLLSSELQFGFKANHSTNMCSIVVKETIS